MENIEKIKDFKAFLQLETKRLLVHYLERDFFSGFKHKYQTKNLKKQISWIPPRLGWKKMQPVIDFFITQNKDFLTDFFIFLQDQSNAKTIDQILKTIQQAKQQESEDWFIKKMEFLENSLIYLDNLTKNNIDITESLDPLWVWMLQESFKAILPFSLEKNINFWQKEIDIFNKKTQILHHVALDNDLIFIHLNSCLMFCETPFLLEKVKNEELLSQKLHFSFLNRILASVWGFDAVFFSQKYTISVKHQTEWLGLLQKKPEIQTLLQF